MNIKNENGEFFQGAKKRREKQNSFTALNPLYFNQKQQQKYTQSIYKKKIPFSSSWKILHV